MTRVPSARVPGHLGWPDDTPRYTLPSTNPASAIRRLTSQITPSTPPRLAFWTAATRQFHRHGQPVVASAHEPTFLQSEDQFALAVTIHCWHGREAASEIALTVVGLAAHGDLESELLNVSDHMSSLAPWESCGLNANRPPRRAAKLPVRDVPGQSVSLRYEQTRPRVARLAGLTFRWRESVPAVCERPNLERRSSEMVLRTCGWGHAWPETVSPVSRTPRLRCSVAVFR